MKWRDRGRKKPRVTFLSRGIWQSMGTFFIVTKRDVPGVWCVEAKDAVQPL